LRKKKGNNNGSRLENQKWKCSNTGTFEGVRSKRERENPWVTDAGKGETWPIKRDEHMERKKRGVLPLEKAALLKK